MGQTNDPTNWEEVWREGRIGFHEAAPNRMLRAHLSRLPPKSRVLVPLCGKAADLAYLAEQGHQVVGVELVESAARAFFDERGLSPNAVRSERFLRLSHGGLTVLAGDFFATTPEDVGPVNALYDRAALVALPPALRERYVQHTRALLAKGAGGLVITFEYDPSVMSGPPFSVTEAELKALYDGAQLELLETSAEPSVPRLRDLGAAMLERCHRIQLP